MITTAIDRDAPLSRRAFDLLCLTMAGVLLLHADHLPAWFSLGLGVVLVLRWWHRRHHGKRISAWFKLPLVLALPLLIIAYYGTLFGRAPGSALAVGLLVLKLLESEHTRDARTGAAFAAFALMSALLFNQGMVATLVVALGLIPALATLNALEPAAARASFSVALWPVARLLLLSIPLALVAFLFVPRLSSPLWGAPGDQQAHSGVSDTMTPGDFTQLLIDDSPAFRVSFDGPPPPPDQRYFRGPVMWLFDGRSWSTVSSGRWHDAKRAEPLQAEGRHYRYTVQMEPTRRHWLFALDVPTAAPAGTELSQERTLTRDKRVDTSYTYQAQSATRYALSPAPFAHEQRLGLMLPRGYDPRARALAEGWRRQYGNHPQAIVDAALRMFHDDGFRYTLAPAPLGRNSIDDFLFDTREGFCEHYASAFTFLMRAAGVPARVVAGYQGGYWNRLGDYLLVRQSDAHAWGEVWIAGRGWVRVDPTAAVRPDRVSLGAGAAAGDQSPWYQRGWLQAMRNRWDVINRWWNQAVTGFNALRQRGLLTRFGVRDADTRALTIALATGTCLLLAAGLALTVLRIRRRPPLLRSYDLLQRRLARCGLARRSSEGPQRYLRRAARALPHARTAIRALADDYIALRYASTTPDPERLRNFRRQVRNFHPRKVVR